MTKAAPDLRKMARGDTSPRMRAAAIAALGDMADKQSLDLVIQRLMEDRSREVRLASAVALAKLGDQKAVAPLLKAFERYPRDRRHFVGPMARFRSTGIVETLIEALDDDDLKVRELSYEALKMLTGETLKKERTIWREWWELDGRTRFGKR
jgi:HEAT repeat protein